MAQSVRLTVQRGVSFRQNPVCTLGVGRAVQEEVKEGEGCPGNLVFANVAFEKMKQSKKNGRGGWDGPQHADISIFKLTGGKCTYKTTIVF